MRGCAQLDSNQRLQRAVATSKDVSPHSSKKSIVTPPDPLRQLRGLDRSSSQFNSQLAKFLDQKEYTKSLPNLCNEDLMWLVEYLDDVSFKSLFPTLYLPSS